ncbi:MAG TPA: acyl-CoA dehydrogenase family protein [Solirubrobacteraceae bacterium]|jgi:alkylation response protein AidB-like acyl-CoA dehydrogenase|nr:acyl-CoA dehydrogenase family protein [Solirubrobacteraceae bacterium]
MNLALSDEQVFLREAARGALSRFKTIEAAREALDGEASALPDLWPTAREAGWAGLLVAEEHGGAGLDAFDAMLVLGECGRVLAGIPLLGHLPASAILNSAAGTDGVPAMLAQLATGERRAAYLPVSPPDDLGTGWTVDGAHGLGRPAAPTAVADGPGAKVSGELAFVPDAPGADVLVGVALLDGSPVGVAIEASAAGVSVEAVRRYDATRSLGHVSLTDAQATLLDTPVEELAGAWHLVQTLVAAESLGSVEVALDVSVEYAKERHTFGRAIGSYQAVKHSLTEVLRQLENGRSLLYYAGWARNGAPHEFPLAASAARSVAGRALDHAARTMISVHGGTGATWEHDAPLYFRRAQLSRRLLGGTGRATDRVAGELIAQADAA